MGGVFNVVNLHTYHYAGNNPVKYVDPDGESPLASGIAGAISAGLFEVAIQGAGNIVEGKGFFEDINKKDVVISMALGFAAGATGVGLGAQGKKAVDAGKGLVKAVTAYNARQAAINAGKIRNGEKTARVLNQAKESAKEMGKAIGIGAGAAVLKHEAQDELSTLFDKPGGETNNNPSLQTSPNIPQDTRTDQ
jgi:hypothetical protein